MSRAVASRPGHRVLVRDHGRHVKSIWCTCGWSAGEPTKIVRKAEVERIGRVHLDSLAPDTP